MADAGAARPRRQRPSPRPAAVRSRSASTSTRAGGRSAAGIRIGARRSPVRTPEQAAALAREVPRPARAAPRRPYELRGPYRRPRRPAAGAAADGRGDPRDAARLGTRAGGAARRRRGRGERRRAAALRQRRRHRLGRAHRGRAGGDRGGGRLGALRADAVRRLQRFCPSPRRCSCCRSSGARRRYGDRARRRLPGVGRGRRRPPAAAVSPSGCGSTSRRARARSRRRCAGQGAVGLQVGDVVWMRHAKAGELWSGSTRCIWCGVGSWSVRCRRIAARASVFCRTGEHQRRLGGGGFEVPRRPPSCLGRSQCV